jgi:hypothetical protein
MMLPKSLEILYFNKMTTGNGCFFDSELLRSAIYILNASKAIYMYEHFSFFC